MPVLIAAKPTPKVIAMKYLPSRVALSLRGGRNRRRRRAQPLPSLRPLSVGGAGRAVVAARAVTACDLDLERDGNARDDVAHGRLRFLTAWNVSLGMGREANTMSKNRYREVVNVVGDAVTPAIEQRARPGSA